MATKIPALGEFRHQVNIFEFLDCPILNVEAVRKHKLVWSCPAAVMPVKGNAYWGAVIGMQGEREISSRIVIRKPTTVAIDATHRMLLDGARIMRVDNVTDLDERGRYLIVEAREERDVRTDQPEPPSNSTTAPARKPGPEPKHQPFKF